MPKSSAWSLPFRFSNKKFVSMSHLPQACYMPTHLILLDLVTVMIFDEAYKLWCSSLCSLQQRPATSSLLDPNTVLSTQFSNTWHACSSVRLRDQVLHPYKTTGKIMHAPTEDKDGEDVKNSVLRK
jgi:hypothetical protein